MIRGIQDVEALERKAQPDVFCSVHQLIERGVARNPTNTALCYLENGDPTDEAQEIGYAQLHKQLLQAASLYDALGATPQTPIAVVLPNVPQNFVAMLAAASFHIAFPINWMLSAEHIAQLLAASGARILVCLGRTPGYDVWEKVQRGLTPSVHVLQVKGPAGATDPAADFDRLCAVQPPYSKERQPASSDTAFYIHTGGTSGHPKIARLSNGNIAYKCWAMGKMQGDEPDQVVLAASPLFHVGGIVLRTIRPLSAGQSCIIPGPLGFRRKQTLQSYWRLVERFKISELSGVPAVLGALSDVPLNGADVSSLQPYASTGASTLPERTARHFEETLGIQVRMDYGATETTASITSSPRIPSAKRGASGIRLPFTSIRVVRFDHSGQVARDCATDEAGEIIAKGPGTIPGYLDSALDSGLFVEGDWVRTGDIGRLDAEGYLWVTGRAKDIIIRSGHNIDPQMIEQTLQEHEAVATAAAVAKPDAFAGELPVAFVQLKEGRSATSAELKTFARQHIPEQAAAPTNVFILQRMPLTDVGKIFKPALREQAALHVLEELISRLVPSQLSRRVSVRTSSRGEITASISLTDPGHDRARIAQAIAGELDRLTIRYELDFAQEGNEGQTS